ncbi:MAG: putative glycoside hydrolase [Fimbriimonadaceae bacterium]
MRFSHSRRSPLYAVLLAAPLLGAPLGCGRSETAPQAERVPPPARAEPPAPRPSIQKPEVVKAVYLTAWSAGSKRKMEAVRGFLRRNGMNAVVIDLRDAGILYAPMDLEPAKSAGAQRVAIRNPKELVASLGREGIYPIARIACFRDDFVPKARPDRAVQDPSGRPWKDRSGHTWLDPYNRRNWEFLAEVVRFALDAGFPEIQLDYVRFPSEGRRSTMVFPAKKEYPNPSAQPSEVVAEFVRSLRPLTEARGALLAGDIFGIVSSGGGDQGIGQELQTIAEPFDLICPMVYPSHFAKGEYGVRDPNSDPYAIVAKSLRDFARKLPNKKLRPWLQDFSLGVRYGPEQVEAQIRAAREVGYREHMLWNPLNRYTERPLQKAQ